MDFQSCPDKNYKWLFNYQDHLTKLLFLRPLQTKTANEVANELLKIFLEVGAPSILQSDNGREFTNSLISELVKMWPNLKILHGRPRHPQSQGSIERSNQDVENMLRALMHDNNSTNWSLGCYFVQFQKNSSFHKVIGRTPYKALFGVDPKVGFSPQHIPRDILEPIEDEDDLRRLLETKQEEKETVEIEETYLIDDRIIENTKIGENSKEIESTIQQVSAKLADESVNMVKNYSNAVCQEIDSESLSEAPMASAKSNTPDTLDICLICPENGGKCNLCPN